ncbi:unnamed protein product [Soboliphyme baturini]|uniref:IFRD domain-containing protein n=1 Tax=Soboliphyme baturini TaxID=241478 RepID=A0A183II13_9BILA|nr:unnamed protein product [Soboliphyme baturini]
MAWKVTASDTVERSLRRGNDAESEIVLRIVVLMSIQLGPEYGSDMTGIVSLMRTILIDSKASLAVRCACATALAICIFNGEFEREVNLQALDALSSVCLSAKSRWAANTASLFCASINAWAFLLLKASSHYLQETLKQDIARVCAYLENSQLEVRIVAGETLALLYEMARDVYGEDFRPANHRSTLLELQNMSTDSVKYRAKRDRRLQRASFREIMSGIKVDGGILFKIDMCQALNYFLPQDW